MAISSGLGSSALLPAGLGFRNVIINGDFKIWQRTTSSAITAASTTSYYADRWACYRGVSGSTISRQTASLEGFQYCARLQRDSGNTAVNSLNIYQSLETVNSIPLAGKTVTLSWYARAGANFSGSAMTVGINTGTGTDQNIYTGYTGNIGALDTTQVITTTWTRYTKTAILSSSATEVGLFFAYNPTGTAGAADYVEITGVQLEQNYQPTPFEQRPIGTELALCQRYYFRQTAEATGLAQRIGGYGCVTGGNTFIGVIRLPVTMRVRPTSSLEYSGLMCTDNVAFDSSGGTWQMLGAGYNTTNSVSIYATPLTGASTITFCQLGLTSNTGSFIGISAEL